MKIITVLLAIICCWPLALYAQTKFESQKIYPAKREIYKKGWIDFNKNGKKDIYEDPE